MVSFNINGQSVDVSVEADTPLLWVVRNQLKLKGTKFGCGKGLCGACTVHLDGTPIRSCSTPVSFAQGKSVTTIEGLGTPEKPHPVQSSWIEENVPQCGYCQPGQMMSASALLAQNPNPSDAEIESYMSGNVCRCGTYPRIKKAIKRAAAIEVTEA